MRIHPQFLPTKPLLATTGDTLVPAGTLFGIGRNYEKHIAELQNKPTGEPVVFLKPVISLIQSPRQITLPSWSSAVHHEVEVAVIIGKKGRNIALDTAESHIFGLAAALDLTCRDIQDAAKAKGLPWTLAKGFDGACPISRITPYNPSIHNLSAIMLQLCRNGQLVQSGSTRDMIFPIPYLIHYLSQFFTLLPGDIILTGTPEGVGKIEHGDTLVFSADFTEEQSIQFI